MPFFSPKTWKQRIVEFPGRRRLDDTSTADVYDVSRAEGTVTQEGDGFTAVNMNDLEQRINNAVNDVAGLNAEEYDPKSTYKKGALRTNNNALWKAKENIDTPEQWTPEHWDSTTIAKELEENRDASKVTYNNESSGLTAQTVQEAIDENAEAISALNSSLEMNTENITDGVIVYYNACTVTIKFAMASKAYTPGTWNTIATIPENLRPASELIFAALNNNVSTDATNTPTWVKITSSGNLQVYALQDRSTIAPSGTISYAI